MAWFTKGAFRKERLGKKLYFLEDTISLLTIEFMVKVFDKEYYGSGSHPLLSVFQSQSKFLSALANMV